MIDKMFGMLLALAVQPPMLMVIENATVAYAPDGERITLPAGSEIDVCEDVTGVLVAYEPAPVVLRVPRPCAERPLFADDFEDAP